MTEKEIWKDVVGYEGLYKVSNLGNVISNARLSEQNRLLPQRELKKEKVHNGYLRVQLHKGKEYKHKPIHRLVAMAFITNHDNKPQVNHKDEKRDNNNVDNLEWVTIKENSNYGTLPKQRSIRKSKPIISVSESGLMRWFKSTKEASANLNVNRVAVSMVLHGKRKHTGGYNFYYANKGGLVHEVIKKYGA